MDFGDEFYKQWKVKSTNNRRLFVDQSDLPKKRINNDKIFSSTTIEDHVSTESFSLRLSDSYVDETQSLDSKQNQVKEVVIINDSSSDESIISYDKSNQLTNRNTESHRRRGIYIAESSEDEISKNPENHVTKIERADYTSKMLEGQEYRRNLIIEESESEIEESRVPQIIKETVTESIILSERKKKEILQWLTTNFDGSRCGSSCSQDSAISNSRKSCTSSGNSSLERLEMNFETPNNRGKLSKPSTAGKSDKKIQTDFERQTTLDKYFPKTKRGQIDITRNKTPRSEKSDNTPVNNVKVNPKKILLPESESFDSRTPGSKKSENTPVNTRRNPTRRILIPESDTFNSKTPRSTNSDKTLINLKESSKKIIIPESESFECPDSQDIIGSSNIGRSPVNEASVIIPESLETSDDTNPLSNSSDSKNEKNNEKNEISANTNINTTINDCADILENLYGATWRNKASTLISATEPRKQTTRKFIKDIQTEKKVAFRKPRFDSDSDNEFSNKENNRDVRIKRGQSTLKKSRTRNKPKDSFINDDSTTESSPDCSYYTALTNPVPIQNNYPFNKTTSKKKCDKDDAKKVIAICDSDSEANELKNRQNWNHRKLSFDASTTSGTSEFDPDDIVPPKSIAKDLKVKKFVNFQSAKPKEKKQPVQPVQNSFLASLSKSVPIKEAEFKAMTYRVKYSTLKEELCKVLYKLFNDNIFDNQLPNDMLIEWSSRLRGTAGKCFNKQSLKALGKTVRSSRIVLATKILDSPDRLRDTLVHEMCHAATWLINNVCDGHGQFWKTWAAKAMKTFPELPPISRCHNYEIQTKYTYKCISCGYSVGRHSKSLDLNTKRCGYCHGKFELLINKVTKDGKVQKKSTAQTKEPSGFALYVKENYHLVKKSGIATKHGEVMKILGQQFSAVKITPKPEDHIRNNEDESP